MAEEKKNKKVTKIVEPKNLDEAVKLLPEVSKSKFVGSVDIDVVLNRKEKQKKEPIRGSVVFPNQFGEDKKIIVFCKEDQVKDAKKAGAQEAGLEDLVEKVESGKVSDFDVVIATPAAMPKIVKLGKVLGPKGLMPNPKTGTVTENLVDTIEKFKSGKFNFKMHQDQGVVRARVGKVDMKEEELKENIITFLKAVFAEAKKLNPNPFRKITLSPTMGAGIKLEISDIIERIA